MAQEYSFRHLCVLRYKITAPIKELNFIEYDFHEGVILSAVVNVFAHAAVVGAGDEPEAKLVQIPDHLDQSQQTLFHTDESDVCLRSVDLDPDLAHVIQNSGTDPLRKCVQF